MQPPPETIAEAIDDIVRNDWGRLLSSLIGILRDFQLAEDSLQDALESALKHWSRSGLPQSPAGWLLQTARRKAIDRIRRHRNFEKKSAEYALLIDVEQNSADALDDTAIPDERLQLIFTCCHPALDEKTRIALTLRTLGGLTTVEIARAFLDTEEAMAQRLVRAKDKIKKAGIPYQVPDAEAWPERMGSVLSVLYLIFNEGYAATSGDTQIRHSLCDEAIRLARILLGLRPGEPEVMGLLALMLLHGSRSPARIDADGRMVPLEHQDRALWLQQHIAEGVALVEQALMRGQLGPYQLQAAISAVHAEAPSIAKTDWSEIVGLYEVLDRLRPNPVVRLNRAAAVSYALSPAAALIELDALSPALDRYQPFHATRADCLRRVGRLDEAANAYDRAIALSNNPLERDFLSRKRRDLQCGPSR
jgi:RNA polymerase sigma-70 factor, ECF subfamily